MNTRAGYGIGIVEEVVFVSHEHDFVYSSGRFSARWVAFEGGPVLEEGPTAVTVDEALAWARSRASVVVAHVGVDGTRYSAGETEPEGEQLPAWRPELLRTAHGSGEMDASSA